DPTHPVRPTASPPTHRTHARRLMPPRILLPPSGGVWPHRFPRTVSRGPRGRFSLLWSDSAARYIPARTAASRHKAGISDVRCEVSSCPAAARRYGPPRTGGHTKGIAMRKRIGLLGLLGVLAGTGPVLAEKPSGLPADVRPDGTEPTPVARELNVAADPA